MIGMHHQTNVEVFEPEGGGAELARGGGVAVHAVGAVCAGSEVSEVSEVIEV